jgi:hypothetical protein
MKMNSFIRMIKLSYLTWKTNIFLIIMITQYIINKVVSSLAIIFYLSKQAMTYYVILMQVVAMLAKATIMI